MFKKLLFTVGLFACTIAIRAQDYSKIKFGKITAEDFAVTSELIDSNTNAVVIADIGTSEFIGNEKGWFSLIFKRHRRIRILNNKGFDAANVSIYLQSNGTQTEKLDNLKAYTHNPESGAVITAKLESKDVFEERLRKNVVQKKFTFPAIKAGSVIEYSYSIKSDFIFNLQPWEFQGAYPTLWSEYEVEMPDFFNYVFLSQGYLSLTKGKEDVRPRNFSVRVSSSAMSMAGGERSFNVSSNVTYKKWYVKNAPAIKEEAYTSTIDNHICKIEFQLSQYRFPNEHPEDVMGNWPKVSEKLSLREDFGYAYTRPNVWLDDEMKEIVKGAVSADEKTRKIYEFVRDHFKCTSTYGVFVTSFTSLKEVFRKRSGSVSDINLLLIAMLRHESINAEPVFLSLRSRGVAHPVYPLLERFNYLVCEVANNGQYYYLDASRPILGFNKLPASCYNGIAWVISKEPVDVIFSADSLKETKFTAVILSNNEDGAIVGGVTSTLGYYESYDFRDKVLSEKKEDVIKELSSRYNAEVIVENTAFDSLKAYDQPVTVKYDLKTKFEEDIIYFNPMLSEKLLQNPFKSANRNYPVEMPFAKDETFVLNMEIPAGYMVDELPKSARVNLNEDEGMFEYLIGKSGGYIQLKSRIRINKATFMQEDYEILRNFFGFIVKKHNEQIVFKKIKQ